MILCSDGLNDELEDQEIAEVLRTHPEPDQATEALIDAALAKGGRDNVSAVLVEYDGPNGVSFSSAMSQKLRPVLPIIGGVAAATLVAVLWWWFYGR